MALSQQKKSKNSKQLIDFNVSNPTHSFLFIKKMLALSVSNVAYLRGLLPEDAFSIRYVEDLAVKIINKAQDERAQTLMGWLKGCFDALEQKYLKKVSMYIRDRTQPRTHILEAYTFSVSYNEGDPSLSVQRHGEDAQVFKQGHDVKAASVKCLRNLYEIVSNLDVLPDDVIVEMALNYYEDRTPSSYEPPGFQPYSGPRLQVSDDLNNIAIGKLTTEYHCMKIKLSAHPKVTPEIEDEDATVPVDDSRADDGSVQPEERTRRDPAADADEPDVLASVEDPPRGHTSVAPTHIPTATIRAIPSPASDSTSLAGRMTDSTVRYIFDNHSESKRPIRAKRKPRRVAEDEDDDPERIESGVNKRGGGVKRKSPGSTKKSKRCKK